MAYMKIFYQKNNHPQLLDLTIAKISDFEKTQNFTYKHMPRFGIGNHGYMHNDWSKPHNATFLDKNHKLVKYLKRKFFFKKTRAGEPTGDYLLKNTYKNIFFLLSFLT